MGVLHPGVRSGVRHLEGRTWRITARPDAAVVVTDVDGADRVVAEPGEVARVVMVPSAGLGQRATNRYGPRRFGRSSDVFAVLSDDAVLLAVPVRDLRQGRAFGSATDAEQTQRETAGVADFALALGLLLEPATESDVALFNASRGVVTSGPLTDRVVTRRRVHALLTVWGFVVLAVLASGYEDRRDETASQVLLVMLTALPFLALAIDTFVGSRQVLGQPRLPESPDRTSVANVSDAAMPMWIREAQLQIGRDDVVLKEYAFEFWTPGPAHGGVVTCVIGWDAVLFTDRHGSVLLAVPAAMWAGGDTSALEAACKQAGIAVEMRADVTLPPTVIAEYDPTIHRSGQALLYSLPLGDWGNPLAITGVTTALAGISLAVAGFVVGFRDGILPTDVLAGGLGAVIIALSTVTTVGLRLWERRLRSTDSTKEVRR